MLHKLLTIGVAPKKITSTEIAEGKEFMLKAFGRWSAKQGRNEINPSSPLGTLLLNLLLIEDVTDPAVSDIKLHFHIRLQSLHCVYVMKAHKRD